MNLEVSVSVVTYQPVKGNVVWMAMPEHLWMKKK